jgi:serine/threonine-protein kinase
MPLTPRTTLGPYQVTAKIGEGGMGEVYRARDTKLDRDVALKVLPQAFTDDPDRLARFEREAKVLASLNHPNIGGIHGLEESDGVRALVLEYIDGPTLADRIAQGPIPIDEALPIAKQIAEALEAAHEAGVIHRDLKPANIKVRDDGTVKVLDFGLAKALDTTPEGDPSLSPTLTAAATQMGVIMGTAAYMSPEQARGRPVDKRADIWAFGAVLFEMLTGKRAFEGEDVSVTLANVINQHPDWEALPNSLSPVLATYLRRCLTKEPKQRIPDIAAMRLAMEGAFETTTVGAFPPERIAPQPAGWRQALPLAVSMLIVGGVITGLAMWSLTRPDVPRVSRFPLGAAPSPMSSNPAGTPSVVVSPDGTRVVYVSPGSQLGGQLYVRQVDQLEAVPLRGAVGMSPFFSPDGNSVGFRGPMVADDNLYRVSILGGPPATLAADIGGIGFRGASWGPDETVVSAAFDDGPLFRLPAAGGEPQPLTDLADGETAHRWPEFLPGGEALLFTVVTGTENMEIWVLDLTSDQRTLIIPGGSNPHYASSGHVVYGVDGTLRAAPFDLDRLEVTGDPITVLEGVVTQDSGAAHFSIGQDGSLVYVTGEAGGGASRSLVWLDHEGREELLGMTPRPYDWPRVSPDGRRVIVDTGEDDDGGDLFLYNVETGVEQQFTTDPALDRWPIWRNDGTVIVFSSEPLGGQTTLYRKAADGSGSTEALTSNPINQTPYDLSADGETLLITEFDPDTGFDIATLQIGGGSSPEKLVQTEYLDGKPAISPNRRWMAYTSFEPGGFYVYVRPFPGMSSSDGQLITTDGDMPLWGPGGDELFYRTSAGDVMAVPVETGGDTFERGTPTLLFPGSAYHFNPSSITWDVAPDGRFLMIKEGAATDAQVEPPSIKIVLNFDEELRRLFPDQ